MIIEHGDPTAFYQWMGSLYKDAFLFSSHKNKQTNKHTSCGFRMAAISFGLGSTWNSCQHVSPDKINCISSNLINFKICLQQDFCNYCNSFPNLSTESHVKRSLQDCRILILILPKSLCFLGLKVVFDSFSYALFCYSMSAKTQQEINKAEKTVDKKTKRQFSYKMCAEA